MKSANALEIVLRRDRWVIACALVILTAACWAYTVQMAREMDGMDMSMMVPTMREWGPAELAMLFIMWVIMMIAMMTPTAAPMILLFASIYRKRKEAERPFIGTGVFVSGYLLAWIGFSAMATLAQWSLHRAAVLSPMMVSTSPLLGGSLLVVAGVFQWMPWKNACLRQCRSPIGFITTEWREGHRGALVMGLKHGAFCTGCCWALMALLFVGGVMNLFWIAALTAFVLIEKAAPGGEWIAKAAGVFLAAFGVWVAGSAM